MWCGDATVKLNILTPLKRDIYVIKGNSSAIVLSTREQTLDVDRQIWFEHCLVIGIIELHMHLDINFYTKWSWPWLKATGLQDNKHFCGIYLL